MNYLLIPSIIALSFWLGGILAAQPTLPTPPRLPGLQVESCAADQVVITAVLADCTRVLTSTKGSTSKKQVRTLTCVK